MLKIENLSVTLGGKRILHEVSFHLRPHRITALVGRNGSGKSTLLACVNQQLSYTGQILEGEKNLALLPPKERAKTVAILPQTLPAPHIPVREMIAFGRTPYLDFTGRLTDRDKAAVAEAMADAHVEALSDRYLDTLSGGERQRAALAMILAQNTPIALLDEPTAHMDLGFESAFLKQLRLLCREKKKTFLVILHDLAMAVRYADDIVLLEDGAVRFYGSVQACLENEILEDHFRLKRHSIPEGEEIRIFFSGE